VEKYDIERVCFYHLAYAGRGRGLEKDDLTAEQTKEVIDLILKKSQEFYNRGIKKEILTVGNSVDGVYVYLKLLEEKKIERAQQVLKLLQWNGGALYSSGVGIGCIDYFGNVHPDQFWHDITLGNVKQRRFSEIWTDQSNPVLCALRDKKSHLKGKCASCKWLDICGGGLRLRAHYYYKDMWAPDPACYIK
jgi:radical SAM protein with 4Fe4S-binding SPASM domain